MRCARAGGWEGELVGEVIEVESGGEAGKGIGEMVFNFGGLREFGDWWD